MQIVIRTDSSVAIGTGHLMRCLTLAECLRTRGAAVIFLCRALPGNIAMQAEKKAFPVFRLADLPMADWQADAEATAAILTKLGQRVDWLIVDHYGLDARWEEAVRPYARSIMVIDDLANRPHCCDLLLDANYYINPEGRYAGLLPPGAELLLGPRYALLRPEFFRAGEHLQPRIGTMDRLLAFFGGSDATNETEKLLTALAGLPERSFAVDVVVGETNHRRLAIERRCTSLAAVGFHFQIDNMAKMIAAADLAVGAGGTSLWERCYLGLPSIVIAVADNQVETAQALAAVGAIHYLGFHTEVDTGAIASAIACLAADPAALMAISAVARTIVPGNGPEAVVSRLLAAGVAKRQVKSPRASAANILVTSASRKIPLLQAVKAAAAKTGAAGIVIAADSDPACLARHFADDFWNMPPLAELTDANLLAELGRRGVRYIIPTRDGELAFWSRKKAWLEEHGIKVMIANAPAIDNCLDKLAFFSRCRELGIPAIATAADIENIVAESYVVKERYGSGARKIGLRLSRQDAVRFAWDLAAPIFQQFVDGREYSVDAYVDLQGKVKGIVCRTRDVIVDGEAQVTTTVADGKLSANCAAYIEKLGLYGHIILQLIIDHQGQEWLIELNPRFGGASTLSLAAGLDSFYWFFLEVAGQSLADHPFMRKTGELRQIRYPADLVEEV